MKEILKIYRVLDWYYYLGFIVLGFVFKTQTISIEILNLLIIGSLLLSYAYSLNDYYDKKQKKKFFVIPIVLIFPLFLFINPYQIASSLLFLIIVTLYSAEPFRLKSVPLLSSHLNGFGFTNLFFIGYFHIQNITLVGILFSLLLFCLEMVVQFIHEVIDFEDDQKEGIKTTLVFFGKNKIKILSAVALVSTISVAILMWQISEGINLLFFISTLFFSLYFIRQILTKPIDLNLRRQYKNFGMTIGIFWTLILLTHSITFYPEKDLDETTHATEYNCKNCNVVIITLDALRADHLGCYGYAKNTSPNIDKLADKGIIFTNPITTAPFTEGSLSSIMTSKYPISHSVISAENSLNESEITLAEILRNHGYTTVAFISHFTLWPELGLNLNQGFDFYEVNTEHYDLTADQTNELVLDWLDRNYTKERKFFMYIHYFDTHFTYTPPSPYNRMYYPDYTGDFDRYDNFSWNNLSLWENQVNLSLEDIAYAIALYDGEIRFVDDNLGGLLRKFDELNLTDNTIFIITADHGENLGEHNSYFNHGKGNMYDTVLKVPLIIKLPSSKFENRTIEQQVQNIDIAPTILNILDIPVPKEFQGISLLSLINGEKNSRLYSYSAILDKIAIRTSDFKYITTTKEVNTSDGELYYLQEDPNETENLISAKNSSLSVLREELISWLRENSVKDSLKQEFNRTVTDRLKELGYLV